MLVQVKAQDELQDGNHDKKTLPVDDSFEDTKGDNPKEDEPKADNDSGKVNAASLIKRRWYGSVLGGGYSFGKRFGAKTGFVNFMNPMNTQAVESHESILADINDVDAAGPLDDKRWAYPNVYGTQYFKHKLAKREAPNKRFIHYYGNMLGRGLSLGKRPEDSFRPEDEIDDSGDEFDDDNELDKRGYKGMLGRGFAFGKRHYYRGGPRRNYLGSVLGRGYSFGKRGSIIDEAEAPEEADTETDETTEQDGKEVDDILKDGSSESLAKRYIYGSPGYRFMFGKRGGDDIDKRYGYLFGRPFSSGKKRFLSFQPKRPYGFVLGNGFSFGKRSGDEEVVDDLDENYAGSDNVMNDEEKRSILLGKGLMFGKRGMKRYGWLLGSGLKFGKRSPEDSDVMGSENEELVFVDEEGSIYGVDENDIKDLASFSDKFNELRDNIELGDDNSGYNLEAPVKRSFGLLLGRGFSYGKRAPTWKRYGHILGGGLSFGK